MIKQLLRTAAIAAAMTPSLLAQSFCWSESTNNTTVIAGTSVSCNYGSTVPPVSPSYTADNEYWRAYNPLARGMTGNFDVTSVVFGVERAQPGLTATTQPGTLKIFRDSTPGNPAPKAGLVLLGSEAVNIPNLTNQLHTFTFTTPITCNGLGGDDLIVCLEIPDGFAAQHIFFIGSNSFGQSSPTYLSSTGCGFPEPTDVTAIGFPNMHMIFDVCGNQTSAGTTTYCTAKINSQGCSPSIAGSGSPSATAAAGFTLSASNELNNKVGLVLYSEFGRDATPFGPGGILCVKAPTRRSKGVNSGGTPPPTADCSGVFSIDFNTFARGLLGTPPNPAAYLSIPGQIVTAQFWGRDPGIALPNNFSLSNGIEFQVGP